MACFFVNICEKILKLAGVQNTATVSDSVNYISAEGATCVEEIVSVRIRMFERSK